MEDMEEGWGDEDIDEVVLTSQWSTAVPLSAAPWVETHSEASTTTRANTNVASHVLSNDENGAESTVQDHHQMDKKKKVEEDTASLRHCLGQLLLQLDITSTTITTTTGSRSIFSSISRPLARRGTLPVNATAAAAAAPPPPSSFGFVEEAVALELIEVMSRCCSSSSSSLHNGNEHEEEGGRGERKEGEEEEDVLQYMVWSRCLHPSLPPFSSSSSSLSSLRQQQQEQQQSERFFLMLCQILGKRDVPVPLFVAFCKRTVLPRLMRLKVAASRALVTALAELASLRPFLLLHHVLLPLLCQPADCLGSTQCEAVTRLVKQGALGGGGGGGGGGGREGGREGGGGEQLEKLLRGLCIVRFMLGEEEDEEDEVVGRSTGDKTRRKRKREREGARTRRTTRRGPQTCEWTDLSLPLLTAVVAQQPVLSDETVLILLERMLGALEGGGGLGHSFKFAAFVNAFVGRYVSQVQLFPSVARQIVAACEVSGSSGGGRDGGRGSSSSKSGGAAALVRMTMSKALLAVA